MVVVLNWGSRFFYKLTHCWQNLVSHCCRTVGPIFHFVVSQWPLSALRGSPTNCAMWPPFQFRAWHIFDFSRSHLSFSYETNWRKLPALKGLSWLGRSIQAICFPYVSTIMDAISHYSHTPRGEDYSKVRDILVTVSL